MKLSFLGTAAGATTRERNSSAILLTLTNDQHAEAWLFDCGERTNYCLQLQRFKYQCLKKIFITHMHADHVLGLLPLITTMSTRDRKEGLKVYGPVGIKDWLEFNLTAIHARLRYPLTIYEYSNNGEVIAQGSSYKIIAYTLLHRCFSSAFRLELGQGSSFRVITIFGDTEPHPNELMAAKNANIVVHEATYQETLRNKAKNHQHSTALQAAQMAKKAGATQLFLTHLSSRYSDQESRQALLAEARSIFANTQLADDGMEYLIK